MVHQERMVEMEKLDREDPRGLKAASVDKDRQERAETGVHKVLPDPPDPLAHLVDQETLETQEHQVLTDREEILVLKDSPVKW